MHTHGLVVLAGVDQAPPAGVAGAVVEVGHPGDDVPPPESLGGPVDLDDLRGELVARRARVGGEGLGAPEGLEVRAADARVAHPQQSLAGLGARGRDLDDLSGAGRRDVQGSHQGVSIEQSSAGASIVPTRAPWHDAAPSAPPAPLPPPTPPAPGPVEASCSAASTSSRTWETSPPIPRPSSRSSPCSWCWPPGCCTAWT